MAGFPFLTEAAGWLDGGAELVEVEVENGLKPRR